MSKSSSKVQEGKALRSFEEVIFDMDKDFIQDEDILKTDVKVENNINT